MNCVVIDYGLCNLLSVYNALKYLGVTAKVSHDPADLKGADRAILPGVGAFKDGMKGLKERHLVGPIRDFVKTGRPFMGICLGMQFLLTKSYEFGEHEGLDLIPGEVRPLIEKLATDGRGFKVPHIGWNQLQAADQPWAGTVLADLPDGAQMYFVHSFHTVPNDAGHTLAVTPYGPAQFASVIARDNVSGCQFHPEKSSAMGLKILDNFIKAV